MSGQEHQVNPLQKFYRREKLYVKLPSRGNFYRQGVVEFNEDQELGILPMTAADEIVLKNPDALLTGKAVADVIKSCVPGVKDPRKLLACDLDVLMIAVRRASYGEESMMTVACPKCEAENTYALDLDQLINSTDTLAENYEVVLPSNLTVFVMPGTFETMVKQNKAAFENAKAQRALGTATLSDEAAMKLLSSAFSSLTKLNFEIIYEAIVKVVYTDAAGPVEVTDKKHIKDFIQNIDRADVDLIEAKIQEVNKVGIAKTMPATCTSCGHKWDARIEFNPVNFS